MSALAAMEVDSSQLQPSSPPLRSSMASAAPTLLFPSSLPKVTGDELSPLAIRPPSPLSSSSSSFGMSSLIHRHTLPSCHCSMSRHCPSTPNSTPPLEYWHPANVIAVSDDEEDEKKVDEKKVGEPKKMWVEAFT